MIFRVFQFWSGSEATIREVELPSDIVRENLDKEITHGLDGVRIGLLNAVYKYGQNDICNKPFPSVSVGDIIELKFNRLCEHWVVANVGFENFGREKHFYFKQSRPGSEIIGG